MNNTKTFFLTTLAQNNQITPHVKGRYIITFIGQDGEISFGRFNATLQGIQTFMRALNSQNSSLVCGTFHLQDKMGDIYVSYDDTLQNLQ